MRDRLLVLLLLGVGAIKVYEEYDEEEKEERDPLELMKHKHSKRDLESVENYVSNPIPIEEETIEAISNGLSPKFRSRCQDIKDECSCKRLLCFGPDSCDRINNVTKKEISHNSTDLVWIIRCRQTFLLGQNLCECKRLLFHREDTKWLTSETTDVPLIQLL
ncbi:unnamed protein product [Heterobilharzia americana]|nr:unnamed protein product [Heterobilharzia americana]